MNKKYELTEEDIENMLKDMGKKWREEVFPPMTSEQEERALKVLEEGFKKIEEEKKNKK